ncbi:uncharacterized protein [Anser cygnoides]|uniref:uncharacterized protein n=1 Tax=Anser cygnoides TaxID=8845 RepID=UPI0034D2551F
MLLLLADGVKIEPLNCVQLSRATSFPLHVVKNCVQETILLYCFLLRSKEHVPFAFRDIGVLTCEDGFPCMKFYLDCVKQNVAGTSDRLQWRDHRSWDPDDPKVSSDCEEKARGQSFHHLTGGSFRRAQDQKSFRVPSWQAAAEEEEAFPPHPDKLGAGHKAARCGEEAVYQEVWNLSSQWDQTDSSWPTYRKRQAQARAEMAAWEAWSEGEDQQIPQLLAVINSAENSSDPLRQGSEGGSDSTANMLGLPVLQPSPGARRSGRGGGRLRTLPQQRSWEQQPSWRDSSLRRSGCGTRDLWCCPRAVPWQRRAALDSKTFLPAGHR